MKRLSMKRFAVKRIVVAAVRLAGRAVDSILITDTPQARHQRRLARVQTPGNQDAAAGVAADVGYTQNSTTLL